MGRGFLAVLRGYAVVGIVVVLVPLAVVVMASFTSAKFVSFPPTRWGFTWYVNAIHDSLLVSAFELSLVVALITGVVAGALGTLAALGIRRYRFPGSDVVSTALLAPIALPHIVIAIGLLELLSFLRVGTAPLGLILGDVAIALPFTLRLAMTGLHGLDPLLEKAAYNLGASAPQAFRKVTLPLIAPAVLAGAVFAFLISWDETTIAIFMSTPGHVTLPVQIFDDIQETSDPGVIAASSLMIAISVVLLIVVDRAFGFLRLLSGGQLGEDR
jgi:putative spermidine/putrescine transport system permease protein